MTITVVAATSLSWWLVTRPRAVVTPLVAATHARTAPATGETGGLSAATCAQCHAAEYEAWSESPHALTLVTAQGVPAEQLAKADTDREVLGRFLTNLGGLWLESPRVSEPVRIDWIFGSGVHARTPVSTWLDPQGRTVMLEHALSWYPPGFLAATLGSDGVHARAGLPGCGKLLDPVTTRACFGCHATRVPEKDGRIDEAAVTTGVGCVRCHADAEQHARARRASLHDPPRSESRTRSPLESIRACGECHRRDDQLIPDDVRPDNLLLVRFAPVGLSQSACFTRQTDRRLDCLTCHDPHVSADRRPLAAAERCLSCHGSTAPHSECPAAPSTSDCTTCHMPKVEVQPHLRFTDHWIRVRDDENR
jgi:predicted CXXCH cytochrome family protein